MATVIHNNPYPARIVFSLDVVSILLFALLARLAHRSSLGFSISGWLDTAWPFLLGVVISWVIIAVAKLRPSAIAPTGIIVWLVTVATGLTIWGLRHGAIPHWSFILVASTVSGVLLLGYRAVLAKKAPRNPAS
ncbi:DUF3054 domain-containing protein [Corynebacterium choanae]|uniref:DUF3054 domain-containing protein n=1 Tax=Corynebacterium choanae TaxID=1862358 RepID=A0A3G6J3R5_9CORY|nr:DUF3054 domain-containing protein [Corynebacterium choanae]AZA12569.1 hypothetical protein CCHOA_00700 [Corynebacterium choanae]